MDPINGKTYSKLIYVKDSHGHFRNAIRHFWECNICTEHGVKNDCPGYKTGREAYQKLAIHFQHTNHNGRRRLKKLRDQERGS